MKIQHPDSRKIFISSSKIKLLNNNYVSICLTNKNLYNQRKFYWKGFWLLCLKCITNCTHYTMLMALHHVIYDLVLSLTCGSTSICSTFTSMQSTNSWRYFINMSRIWMSRHSNKDRINGRECLLKKRTYIIYLMTIRKPNR